MEIENKDKINEVFVCIVVDNNGKEQFLSINAPDDSRFGITRNLKIMMKDKNAFIEMAENIKEQGYKIELVKFSTKEVICNNILNQDKL